MAMRKIIPIILTSTLALFWLVRPFSGQTTKEKFPKPARESPLESPSELRKKIWLANKQRNDVVEHAIEILRGMAPTETASGDYYESLFVLSRFRAAEGIEILSKRLLYQPVFHLCRSTYDSFAASEVLTSIGPPAIPAMLRIIRDPDRPDLERRIACWVLLRIEASSDPEAVPDDDAVKEAVLMRLSRLKFLRDSETFGVSEAQQFIEHFADTEGRWQELPVILDGPVPVHFDKPINHQFRCQKPLEHPDATIEFMHNETLAELGLALSKSGMLTGSPKSAGRYRFTISAKATWKNTSGKVVSNFGAARFGLVVHSEE